MDSVAAFSLEPLWASSRSSEKLKLPALQSKMKVDPEGYETELRLVYNQFKSSLDHFQQQAALNRSGVSVDPTMAKDLGDFAMFLAHVTPFYPKQLAGFPKELGNFLANSAGELPSGLRGHVAQAIILLINRQIIDIEENLSLFMELQILDDRNLRKLAFSHVIQSVKRMNKKHKNEAKNKALQQILFKILKSEDEARAKRALVTLCELHRRKVWFDDRTANAICEACCHPLSRIRIAALSFVLDYEKIDNDEDDSDASSSEDESASPHVVINKETIYKAHHKGTAASKRKKKAKLQRAVRSMKRQQRISSHSQNGSNLYTSPLNHLKDPQGFAEKIFSILRTCNERFEVKMMMLKVIARTIGLHRLILLDFYPFLQRYVQPHQKEITNLLAAAVQACHDMVPPEAVQDLFKQLVNQFVHDRSRPEVIAVGLNVIREICVRIPLLMTEELLQDLALYKKSHEKAVSAASRSLIALFREVCPSLLIKKDRGRPVDPKARPKAYGEIDILTDVPGAELLMQENENNESEDEDDDSDGIASIDSDDENETIASSDDEQENQLDSDDDGSKDDDEEGDEDDDSVSIDKDEDDDDLSLGNDEENKDENDESEEEEDEEDEQQNTNEDSAQQMAKSSGRKRKLSDFDGQLATADTSLRALKRLAEAKLGPTSSDATDGILSNEDFKKIRDLSAKKDAKVALARQGFKVPTSDQLSVKRFDPSKLEAHIKQKLNKEERLALVRAGREDRGKYQARASVKQKKTGGSSNRQKEHKKAMPLAAKRDKVHKSRINKKKKKQLSGKQFRGKKAWK